MRSCRWMLASLLVCGAPAFGQEPVQPEENDVDPQAAESEGNAASNMGMLPPEEPGRPRFVAPLGFDEVQSELSRLVAKNPEMASIEVIGKSRDGLPLSVLVLTDSRTGDASVKPGLFFAGDRTGRLQDAEAESALDLAWSILSGEKPELIELLGRTSLYIAPVLDPDARLAEREHEILFDGNFPCGWCPTGGGSGAGRIPLARPETLAVARFLSTQANLVLVVGRIPEENLITDSTFSVPDGDRRVLADLLGGQSSEGFVGWRIPSAAAGSLFDFAYFAGGTYSVGWPGRPAVLEDTPAVFETRVLELSERIGVLIGKLPALSLTIEEPKRLTGNMWSLDVRLANGGALPTESALSQGARADRLLTIEVQGARVVATAARDAGQAAYSLLGEAGAGPRTAVGVLAAQGERWVRLILEAEDGAQISVGIDGAWVSRVAETIVLP